LTAAADVMKRYSVREVLRLILVACGVLCLVPAVIVALVLVCSRSEPGVVKFYQTFQDGLPRNYPYVLWGNGMCLDTEPHDWFSPPKAGDSVTVLAIGKAGLLKFGRPYWRAWAWTAGFCVVGAVLVIAGLRALRFQRPKKSPEPPPLAPGR
jgi:hypothetical protein